MKQKGSRFIQAIHAMHEARLADGRAFGELLRQAVSSSLRLIIIVGGLVVFFSVMMELLVQTGWLGGLYGITEQLLRHSGLPPSLSPSLVGGLFEVTLGNKEAGSAGASIPLVYKVAAAAFVLSWGGLSVHAQIMSVLSNTPMRYGPFLFARAIHALIAPVLVLLLWTPMMGRFSSPVLMEPGFIPSLSTYTPDWGLIFLSGMIVFVSLIVLLLFLAILSSILKPRRHAKNK
jgi:nucleoside recognition membrane protein YjiH